MRKKFIRVAVFCALTATAAPVFVGCSDYDDDINRLQGEIDQINGFVVAEGAKAGLAAPANAAITAVVKRVERGEAEARAENVWGINA